MSNCLLNMKKRILELSNWLEKMRLASQKWELQETIHVRRKNPSVAKKGRLTSTMEGTKESLRITNTGSMVHGDISFFHRGSSCLSQNSTGLQIHLQIPDSHSAFQRLKKDHCGFEQEIISIYFILIPWEIRFLKIFQLHVYLCDPSFLTTKCRSYESYVCQAS